MDNDGEVRRTGPKQHESGYCRAEIHPEFLSNVTAGRNSSEVEVERHHAFNARGHIQYVGAVSSTPAVNRAYSAAVGNAAAVACAWAALLMVALTACGSSYPNDWSEERCVVARASVLMDDSDVSDQLADYTIHCCKNDDSSTCRG